MRPETADDTDRNRRYVGMMPKFFTGVDVREVNLYDGECNGREGISDGDAGMCVGGGIYQDTVCPVNVISDDRDEFAFVIGLEDFECNWVRRCRCVPVKCVINVR